MPSIGIRNNIVRIGSKLNPTQEVKAYISGLTTPLSSVQVTKLDIFVRSLKTGLGISALSDAFDVMYILGGETAESSLRNLVKNAHHATAVNSPTFTAFEGFTGDGTSQYIDTKYNPATQAVRYTLNDAALYLYCRSEEFQGCDLGQGDVTPTTSVYLNSAGDIGYSARVNDSALNTGSVLNNPLGFSVITRTSTQKMFYRNKVLLKTFGINTDGIDNNNFLIMRRSTFYSGRQLSIIAIGKRTSVEEIGIITDVIEAYMDSNGKGVIS